MGENFPPPPPEPPQTPNDRSAAAHLFGLAMAITVFVGLLPFLLHFWVDLAIWSWELFGDLIDRG